MLWESKDPRRELTKRFGFSDASAAAEWVAGVLDRHWALEAVRCDRFVISDRNVMAWVRAGDRRLIAKWSSLPARFPRLEEAARVVAWLDAGGVPVAAPISTTDGRLLVEIGNDSRGRLRSRLPLPGSRFLLGVLPVVGGQLLDVDDLVQVKQAGRMLARLHAALAAYPGLVSSGRRGAGRQPVHNDFRSANILYEGARISAVLDFEELTLDTRVADVAKSAVLLATRYHDWRPTSESVRAAYVNAYDDLADDRLTFAERREIDERIAAHLASFGWVQ